MLSSPLGPSPKSLVHCRANSRALRQISLDRPRRIIVLCEQLLTHYFRPQANLRGQWRMSSEQARMTNAESRRLYEMKAEVLHALAHPIRLAIAETLRDGERCVCEIAQAVGAERSNVSRHLAVMVKSGLLTSRKEGLMVYYALRCPCILEFFSCVETVLRDRLSETRATLKNL